MYGWRENFYEKLRKKVIARLENDKNDEIQTAFLTDKKEIAEWIFCRLFDQFTTQEKRMLEKKNITKQTELLFFKLGSTVVPLDVMKVIASFMKKGRQFLNRFGLVNEQFYILSLVSFEKYTIKTDWLNDNALSIPILVLNNLKSIVINGISQKDVVHVFSNLNRIEKLEVQGRSTFPNIVGPLNCEPKDQSKDIEQAKKNIAKIKTLDFGKRANFDESKGIVNWIELFTGLNHILNIKYHLIFGSDEDFKAIPFPQQIKSLSFRDFTSESIISNTLHRIKSKELRNLSLLYSSLDLKELKKLENLQFLKFEIKKEYLKEFNHIVATLKKLKNLNIKIRGSDQRDGNDAKILEIEDLKFLENMNQGSIIRISYPNLFGIDITQDTSAYRNRRLVSSKKKEKFEKELLLYFKSFDKKLIIVLHDSGHYIAFNHNSRLRTFCSSKKIGSSETFAQKKTTGLYYY